MKSFQLFLHGFVIIGLTSAVQAADTPVAALPFDPQTACTTQERWTLFDANRSPALGFAQAYQSRARSRKPLPRALAEYAMARALLAAGLPHLAYPAFETLLTPQTPVAVRGIAARCIGSIHAELPTFPVPQALVRNTSDLTDSLWQALLLDGKKPATTRLRDSEELRQLTQTWQHLEQGNYTRAIELLAPLVESSRGVQVIEQSLGDLATARLLLARAYYGLGQYGLAARQLQVIPKSSNLLTTALTELSWAQLRGNQLREAIGTAIPLQAGAFRNTYSPEALMVMAMAFNELCHFPASLKTVHRFRVKYEPVFKWLEKNQKQGLYPLALNYLKKKKGPSVPEPIVSEWVRTPHFQAHQREINRFFDETAAFDKFVGDLERQTKLSAKQLLEKIPLLNASLEKAVKTKAPDAPWPAEILGSLRDLKAQFQVYESLLEAKPWFAPMKKRLASLQSSRSKQLVQLIETRILEQNEHMFAHLGEIAENLQLVEIEIYSGASQDLVWRNAHPDYAKKISDMGSAALKADRGPAGQSDKERTGPVWMWGKAQAAAFLNGEQVEVWEDELGSFQVELVDHCSNKDRYLAVKKE